MCCAEMVLEEWRDCSFDEIPVDERYADVAEWKGRQREPKDVQTVICSKERFSTVEEARSWIRENTPFRTDKVDVTEDSYRFRQFDPGDCKDNSQRTIELTRGVKAVICSKKEGRTVTRNYPGDSGVHYAEFPIKIRKVEDEAAERALETRPHDEEKYKGKDKEKKRTLYEVAISSEAEIERSFFGNWIEVLGHAKDEIDMSRLERGAAVLVDHRGDQVGSVVPGTARVDDDKIMRAYLQFSSSQRGQEVERDVEEGIRTSISVGYFIKSAKLVEKREVKGSGQEKATIDIWRITRWQPAEVSLVSVPADVAVGVGRQQGAGGPPLTTEDGRTVAEGRTMSREVAGEQEAEKGARPSAGGVAVLTERNKEVAEILGICDTNGVPRERSAEWLGAGLTVDQVARKIVELRKTKGDAQPAEESVGDKMGKDRRRYSYVRAIRLGAGLVARDKGDRSEEFSRVPFDGLEAEVHRELVRTYEPGRYQGGIVVPVDTRSEEDRWHQWEVRQGLMHRTLDSKTLTKGTETVFERPGELIELLRNRAVVLQLGARMLAGLSGPVAFPKQTGGMTVYWVGENPASDVTASDVALGLVNLAQKNLQGTTDYTRQLLAQSSLDVEMMVREEFAIAHGLTLDKSAIHGKGAAGEPTGVYKAPDVNVRAVGGIPDYADVIEAEAEVAKDNADLGSLGWITTPGTASRLMQTLDFTAAAAGQRIWVGTFRDGVMGGYRAAATNQVSSTMTGSEETGGTEQGAVFGNWADLVFGTWASMELIVDPFAKKKRGIIEVTSFQMADLILRHGESFCKWTGSTP